MKFNKKEMLFVVGMIVVFPVLITLILKVINVDNEDEVNKSGIYVLMETGGYTEKMDVEMFIPCVLMAQLPMDSSEQLINAQAVVIRSYILNKINMKNLGNSSKLKDNTESAKNKKEDLVSWKKRGNNIISSKELGLPFVSFECMKRQWFDAERLDNAGGYWVMVGNLTGMGKTRIFEKNLLHLENVIRESRGYVIKQEGCIVAPLFHAISNGTTRDGGKLLGEDYKYLKSVECNTDKSENDYCKTQWFTVREFCEKLLDNDVVIYHEGKEIFLKENSEKNNESNKNNNNNESNNGTDNGTDNVNSCVLRKYEVSSSDFLKGIELSEKDEWGYVRDVKIFDTKITGDKLAKALELSSTDMTISGEGNEIKIITKGVGHGFGMSLAYGKQLAKEGKDWKDILNTFYDATITKCKY